MLYDYIMMGSVLILGSTKGARLKKAWDLAAPYGFKTDTEDSDLLVISKEAEKKSIGIHQAKSVKKFLQERPFHSKIKVVLIEDAQALTDDAQGNLLKILEEPPTFALIILLSDNEGSLLSTVVSRCQKIILREEKLVGVGLAVFDLKNKSYEELFDLAKEISQKDKGDALEFLEQLLRYDITHDCRISTVTALEKAIKDIKEANVALKFALEYVFLLHKGCGKI